MSHYAATRTDDARYRPTGANSTTPTRTSMASYPPQNAHSTNTTATSINKNNENLYSHDQSAGVATAYASQDGHEKSLPRHRSRDGGIDGGSGQWRGPGSKYIRPEGESYRRGFHPLKFLRICFRSSCFLSMIVNVLWPFVPVAFAVHYARHDQKVWNFILPYIAMIPAANLLGFAGQELARKLPHVAGIVMETTFGSVVEIILFMVLLKQGKPESVQIIKGAIIGSILANLLLCLGFCFFAGGLRREEQVFHEAVSEVGSNLMLVAGMGLVIPTVFTSAAAGQLEGNEARRISRGAAIVLFIAYGFFVWYQVRSHRGLYEEVLAGDEEKDADKHKDLRKAKLTLTEAIIGVAIAITMVTFMAIFLVEGIHFLVEDHGVKDAFLGLILVPLVEKFAEHITAIDEAWDNQMNFALSHILGSTIQTALFVTPLVIFVSWGLPVREMDLEFGQFEAIVLILAILVVGNFLRDKKSNYLEGALCVLVYIIIAIGAFFYPNPTLPEGGEGGH